METIIAPLRPFLQSITHNLPLPIRDTAISLLGDICYKTIVLDINPEPICTKLAISKALGIAIISASAVVKIPQLLKLYKSKSAVGLSFPAYLLETISYLISLAYNYRQGFPFSTYGETMFITIQNVVIGMMILIYSGHTEGGALFLGGLAMGGQVLFTDVLGMAALQKLMACAGLLGVASKVPQIYTVYQQGGTGQLSAFAVN